jgi:anti-sigma B factor antagonist
VTLQPPRFRIIEKKVGSDASLLVLRGELDIHSAPAFREAVAAADIGAPNLVMDLSEMEFIDSSGIQVLLEEQKRLHEKGGRLVIVCGNSKMLDLFRLTGVDKLCSIVSSRSEALEAGQPT